MLLVLTGRQFTSLLRFGTLIRRRPLTKTS